MDVGTRACVCARVCLNRDLRESESKTRSSERYPTLELCVYDFISFKHKKGHKHNLALCVYEKSILRKNERIEQKTWKVPPAVMTTVIKRAV